MNLMKKKKGFTLIELMAVIAIIAILAAVLVPTVSGYINRAKKTAVITQVREVVNAIETNNATDPTPIVITAGTVADKVAELPEDMRPKKDKLGAMTITDAYAINKDSNAAAGITLKDGVFETYTPGN